MNSIIRVRINRTATGRRIHEALRASGMTVEECASILGFESPRALYRIFSGQYLPSTEHLIGIALLTGVPVEELTAVEMTADGSGLQDFEIAARKRGLAYGEDFYSVKTLQSLRTARAAALYYRFLLTAGA